MRPSSNSADTGPRPATRTDPGPMGPGDRPGYICFSAQDWWYHSRAHSDIQLMLRVAASRRVLFVNSITMRMPLPGRSKRFARRILRKAASMSKTLKQPVAGLPNFWVLTPVLLPLYGSPRGRRANAALVRAKVARAARRAGIGRAVMFVTIPTAWEVVREMSSDALLFNRSDKHSTFPEADSHYIGALEDDLLRRADRVLYVSRALMDQEIERTGNRAHFLDHGVDLQHFRRTTANDEPADLASIPHPRIGFFGGLDDYLVDFDLLERVASSYPQAQLVLVGDASCSMRRFDKFANVHWLGFRPYEQIPSYGAGFDVALMPWLRNEWIYYSNPIKLKEYLALGLPIVTTEIFEAHRYEDVLSIAEDPDQFIRLVGDALRNGVTEEDATRRRAAVLDDSWDRRAVELIELVEGKASDLGLTEP
jgi:glycosyltransferase involved in cell wall biosynthesis